MSEIDEMRSGFETAYIDGAVASGSTYRPGFVSNNKKAVICYSMLYRVLRCMISGT